MEYDTSGNLLRRYVHGADAKADDPIAWYEGAAMTGATERFLRSDYQGSIVTVSTASDMLAVNRYDEYGIPQVGNAGRFQYTGQAWLPDLGMYYYKARMYSPTLGRFMQTDPIGYEDGINWYAYVGNDPVNGVDPTGQNQYCFSSFGSIVDPATGTITVGIKIGENCAELNSQSIMSAIFSSFIGSASSSQGTQEDFIDIPCSAALEEGGDIDYNGAGVILIFGGGLNGSKGSWANRKTGTRGKFSKIGGGLGFDLGASVESGNSVSLSDFEGYGEDLSAGVDLGPVSIGGTRSNGPKDGSQTGGSGVFSKGAGPSPKLKGVGVSFSATAGETSISQCQRRAN